MTDKVKAGLVNAGSTGQVHPETPAYRNPKAELVAVSIMLLEAAKKRAANYRNLSVYDHQRPILTDNALQVGLFSSFFMQGAGDKPAPCNTT